MPGMDRLDDEVKDMLGKRFVLKGGLAMLDDLLERLR